MVAKHPFPLIPCKGSDGAFQDEYCPFCPRLTYVDVIYVEDDDGNEIAVSEVDWDVLDPELADFPMPEDTDLIPTLEYSPFNMICDQLRN